MTAFAALNDRRVAAVVPAAGRSSRFGSDKRRALIDGMPMLARVVALLAGAGLPGLGAAEVIVIGPADNPDVDRGMFSSIQIGLARALAAPVDAVIVHPADMPFVRPDTIRAVTEACLRASDAPVCPRYRGKRGHPLVMPSATARALLAVAPSTPLNEALTIVHATRLELDVDDPGVVRDVDVPADLTSLTIND